MKYLFTRVTGSDCNCGWCNLTYELLLMSQPIILHYCCDIKSGLNLKCNFYSTYFNKLNYYYKIYIIIAGLTAASFFF